MTQKAACYLRVSTKDKQDYERQKNELIALCQEKGFALEDIEIFAEKVSGYKTDESRPEMFRLLNTIEKAPSYFSKVFVTEISRIGRTGKIVRDTIDTLKANKIPLWIKNLGLETLDKDGRESIATNIIVAVFSEIADEYARTFAANSKSGLRQAASVGKAGGSLNFPYGYTKDGPKGMLVIEPTEAKIIEEIFNLYKSGNGIKVIAGILNERNVLTRMNKTHAGKTINYKVRMCEKDGSSVKWSDKQTHDILRNSIYCGKRRFKGEVFDAPAIISIDLFEECKEIMQGKTHRNYLTQYIYLLKDTMVCGSCGRNYFARYKPTDTGDKVYICSSRLLKAGNCGNAGCNISLIESAIYDQLLRSDNVMKYLNNTNGIKVELVSTTAKLKNKLTVESTALKQKKAAIERLSDSYYNDNKIGKDTYYLKLDKFEKEILTITSTVDQLTKEIRKSEKLLSGIDDTKATKAMLINASKNRGELQAMFKQIVKKIIINKLDKEKLLATVYISVSGVALPNTLKLILDMSGIRKKPQQLRYLALRALENEPVYKNDKLMVDVDDIVKELEGGYLNWISIEPKNTLTVEPPKPHQQKVAA